MASGACRASELALLALLSLVGVVATVFPGLATADELRGKGPWRAQIVDAETKRPLQGVVVLAIWNERFGSVGGLAGGGYFDSEEVVTGADGKFTIRRRKTSFNPFSVIVGPEFYIFKPGYGQWLFQGAQAWPEPGEERTRCVDEAWAKLNGDGAVLEMPPLKTKEERRRSLDRFALPSGDVPASRFPSLFDAVNDERLHFRLQPLGKEGWR